MTRIQRVAILILLTAAISAIHAAPSSEDVDIPGFGIHFKLASEFSIKHFQSHSADTQCIDFYKNKTRDFVGSFCASRDENFFRSRGIVSSDELIPNGSDSQQNSDFTATTPMGEYSMSKFSIGKFTGYYSSIDCDNTNGYIYRATATCRVNISITQSGKRLYSQFITTDNVKNKIIMSDRAVDAFWLALQEE